MQEEISALRALTDRANELAFELYGFRNSCIATSAAVCDALIACGIPAELMRVSATVFGGKGHAACLGSDGDGQRRPASKGWHGHLVVVASNQYLIDATLDQAGIEGLRPLVREVSPAFLRGEVSEHFMDCGDSSDIAVYYHAFPGRNGWKSKPAFRPTQRRPIVDALLDEFA